jgi:hypothetical protein
MYGDLAHKAKQHNMFFSFMKVMLKQQVILPREAPSQNIVLNVFNCELILLHLTKLLQLG